MLLSCRDRLERALFGTVYRYDAGDAECFRRHG